MPPGTGDVAISVAQLIPGAEILVVTTPQQAAAEVASGPERSRCRRVSASRVWSRTCRGWSCRTAPGWRCSARAAARLSPDRLTKAVGATVPLLGQIPLEQAVREGGDAGSRSSSVPRTPPPVPRCATSRTSCRCVRVASPVCRSGSTPSATSDPGPLVAQEPDRVRDPALCAALPAEVRWRRGRPAASHRPRAASTRVRRPRTPGRRSRSRTACRRRFP
ncbi:P-loop NTPase [Rhodococcus hoagii]|nr:P-loop NTPase [Prescottella equi]